MSDQAPWSYQGMPSGSDTGQVKLFDPSQMQQTNQPNTAIYNGHPEVQDNQGQGYFPQHQNGLNENSNIQDSGQMYQNNEGQMNYGYNQYDPHLQYYNQQQFWNAQQQGYDQQAYGQQYQNYNQQWANTGYQQPYEQSGNTLNVNAEQFVPNTYLQPENVVGQGQIVGEHGGEGQNENDSLNLSHTSCGSSTSYSQSYDASHSGMGEFFRDDSLSNSCENSMNNDNKPQDIHPNVYPVESLPVHTEVSNESLQTVNYSTASLPSNSTVQNNDVNALSSQMQEVNLNAVADEQDFGVKHENVLQTPDNVSATTFIGEQPTIAQNVPDTSPEGSGHSSGGSGHSEGLSDWEVVPPQMLMVPGHQSQQGSAHSREGSLDNNVQFFIGSSRNSEEGTPESFLQGQQQQPPNVNEVPSEQRGVIHPVNPPLEKVQSGEILGVTTNTLVPQHTSSPNMSPAQKSGQSTVPPPMPPAAGPPLGQSMEGGNPFRKDKGKTPNYVSSGIQDTSEISKHSHSGGDLKQPTLQINAPVIGPPSPIVSSSEETVIVSHPNTPPVVSKAQPNSPIMPRKESPFQPPSRRRTSSGQSASSIEEHPKLESQLSNEGNFKPEIPVTESREKSASMSSQSSRGSNRGSTMKSNEKPPSEKELEMSKYQEMVKKASKPPTGPSRGVMSPRRIESAFQQVQKQRAKHNMSPATSLWADNDLVLPPTNILLAPAAPALVGANTSNASSAKGSPAKTGKDTRDVLSPVQMLITSLSEKQSKESTPERGSVNEDRKRSGAPSSSEKRSSRDQLYSRETRRDVSPSRERHERGSSIDRELEISRKIEDRDSRREREDYRDRERDYYRDERYRDREPRDRYPRDPRNAREYDQYYDKRYRERGQYGDERYERPRSRHSQLDEERSSSRQEYDRPRSRQDSDRPRSRQDYGRDYYRDKYGRAIEEIPESREGYDYDRYYGRGYYDRHGYYDRRYYDKYYGYEDYSRGNMYDESFNRLLHFDSTHGNWANYGYPGQYNDPYGPPYEDGYRQSQRSRVHTPGSLSESGDQLDYSYAYGSRSSSRQGYDEYSRAQWDAYYANYNRGYGYQDPYYQQETRPGRMTPAKHSIPHLCVRFGPGGQLVKVMPNRPADGEPATVEIHDLSEMLQDNPETDELKSFPGPLVRSDTHKNDVLVFCQRKSKECLDNIKMTDRESAELLWKYLELLIKQNGTFVGTDVADLLLEGHEPTTVEYSMMGLKVSSSLDNLDEEFNETIDTNISTVTFDRSVINKGKKSIDEVTDRFRHLLLYGRKKDALEWAMKNNLWGHALFLASKMDSRAHANVMTRFANSAMKMNDPLQTLYQLMSGRQPAAVTCITDEKWGDWRPHLAMVLANRANRPDLEKKSIMTLGDTLSSKGFLHASHLCYLMAQVNFGSYQKKTSKMVLIGSNHSLPLKEFAVNEAIQCTEIFEYAMSLGNPNYFSINFQYFKFLYACRLAENGFAQEALQYFEVISHVIQQSPTLFQPVLVKLVYEFGNRLKYSDPQLQHTGDEMEDPFWLQQLQRINQGFMDGSIQPVSGSVTPYGAYGLRSASTESGEVAGYTTGTDPNATINYTGYGNDMSQSVAQTYDQTMHQQQQQQQQPVAETSQNYTEPYQHYQEQTSHQYPGHAGQMGTQQVQAGQVDTNQVQTGQKEGQVQQEVVQPKHDQVDYNYQYYYNQEHQQWEIQYQQPHAQPNASHVSGEVSQVEGTNQLHENQMPVSQPHNEGYYQSNAAHNPSTGHRRSIASTLSGSGVTEEDEEPEDEEINSGGQTNFSYFDNIQHKPIVAPRLRKRTESEASNSDKPQMNNTSANTAGSTTKEPENLQKTETKPNQPQQQGKGMLSGLFNKILGKGKNEMKLPDDTKKTIVWDPEKKKWKNLEATEEEEKPPPPPPKDMSSSIPAASDSSMGPPTGNKFSLRRVSTGAAAKYVDVMNSKPAPTSNVPQSLFNVMPSSHSSPAIFSPGGPSEETTQSDNTNSSQVPPVSQDMAGGEGPDKDQVANGVPTMFNPAQFQGNQPTTGLQSGSTRSSGRLRPGQRRQYPK